MKRVTLAVVFSFLFFLVPEFMRSTLAQSASQAPSAPAPTGEASPFAPGCGQGNDKFDVKTDETKHPLTRPEAGKALLYLMQDDQADARVPRPTVRWGLDKTWIGATHANSYFYLSIDPGEHHLCASWAPSSFTTDLHPAGYAFTAVSGETYYFRVKNAYFHAQTIGRESNSMDVDLLPVNGDEAELLMSQFAFSRFEKK